MAWGKVKDQDFVGKEAYVRDREEEPAAILCTLTVDEHSVNSGPERYMLGGEPVLTRHGQPLTDTKGRRSFVTSAGAGPSVGQHILLSYLPPEHANVGERLTVQYMGERYPVTVARNDSTPLFDPDNERVRS
jgi:glycine cleavage system aminomethyltransferase T